MWSMLNFNNMLSCLLSRRLRSGICSSSPSSSPSLSLAPFTLPIGSGGCRCEALVQALALRFHAYLLHICVGGAVVVHIGRHNSFCNLSTNLSVRIHKGELILLVKCKLHEVVATLLRILVDQLKVFVWRPLAALLRRHIFTEAVASLENVCVLKTGLFLWNIRFLVAGFGLSWRVHVHH